MLFAPVVALQVGRNHLDYMSFLWVVFIAMYLLMLQCVRISTMNEEKVRHVKCDWDKIESAGGISPTYRSL